MAAPRSNCTGPHSGLARSLANGGAADDLDAAFAFLGCAATAAGDGLAGRGSSRLFGLQSATAPATVVEVLVVRTVNQTHGWDAQQAVQ